MADRVLEPTQFVGEPVTRIAGDDTRRGRITAYDPLLRRWRAQYEDGQVERLNERQLEERGPPRTRCAQELGVSARAISEYLKSRECGESDWYLEENSGLSPYQQRQMAQLTTSSDYAVCRGKRGAPEHRLCTCGSGEVENTEHAVLRCPHYGELRGPMEVALQEHTAAIRDEHGHEMTALEALRWAIDNSSPGPVTPTEITEASLAKYRQALLEFHRKSKWRRYEMQQAAADQHPRAL